LGLVGYNLENSTIGVLSIRAKIPLEAAPGSASHALKLFFKLTKDFQKSRRMPSWHRLAEDIGGGDTE